MIPMERKADPNIKWQLFFTASTKNRNYGNRYYQEGFITEEAYFAALKHGGEELANLIERYRQQMYAELKGETTDD